MLAEADTRFFVRVSTLILSNLFEIPHTSPLPKTFNSGGGGGRDRSAVTWTTPTVWKRNVRIKIVQLTILPKDCTDNSPLRTKTSYFCITSTSYEVASFQQKEMSHFCPGNEHPSLALNELPNVNVAKKKIQLTSLLRLSLLNWHNLLQYFQVHVVLWCLSVVIVANSTGRAARLRPIAHYFSRSCYYLKTNPSSFFQHVVKHYFDWGQALP